MQARRFVCPLLLPLSSIQGDFEFNLSTIQTLEITLKSGMCFHTLWYHFKFCFYLV